MIFFQILIIGLVAVFVAYQIYALVRGIKKGKKKPPDDNNKMEDKK